MSTYSMSRQPGPTHDSPVETAEWYRQLVEAVPNILCIIAPSGKTIFVNSYVARVTGYAPSELIGKNWWGIFYPGEERAQVEQLFQEFEQGDVQDYEMVLTTKNGSKRTLSWTSVNVRGADGQVLHIFGIGTDVTEHKWTEKELRRLKEFNERIVHGVDEGLLIEDTAGVITFANPALEALLDYSAGELIGRHWRVIVPQADVELVQAETARRPADVASQYETHLLTKDGTETPVIVSARPLFKGDVFVGVLSAFTDITQRKQAEEALRRERDFSQSIIETTPALVVVLDADGHITLFNRACEELTGYTAAEAIGHTMWEFLIPGRFVRDVQEVLSRMRADVPFSNYEIPLLTRDRNERWITWAHTNVKDEAGNVVAIVGVGVDVTDFRRVQQTLERRNRELQALVEAGQLLTGTLDLDEVLDRLLDVVQKQLNMGSVSFSSYDPATQTLEIRAQRYPDALAHFHARLGQIGEQRTRDQHPHSSRALDTGQLIYEPDLWNAPHITKERRDEARALNIRSVVEVPLIAKGQPVGVLHLRSFETPRFFTDEELALARAIAPPAAAAIDNAQLYGRLAQRMQEISTLHHAGQVLTGVIDMGRLLPFVVEAAVAMFPSAERGTIQLYDEESNVLVTRAGVGYSEQELAQMRFSPDASIAGRCFATSKSLIVDDVSADPYFQHVGPPAVSTIRSMMAVPLVSKGRSIGVLCVDSLSTTSAFTDNDVRVLSTLAAQAAAAIEAAHLFAEVDAARTRAEELAARVVRAQEEERRRIARELHDEVGQLLTGAKLSQEMLAADLPAELAELRERALENVGLIDETMEVVRKLSFDLRPAALDELGLSAALEWHVERYQHQTGLEVTLRQEPLPRELLDHQAMTVYRIVQEALTNVARHASASEVLVEVTCEGRSLRVQVTDNGCGFDAAAVLRVGPAEGHFGLVGLQERATLLGGKARIESSPGQGTRITVELPLPECE